MLTVCFQLVLDFRLHLGFCDLLINIQQKVFFEYTDLNRLN